MKIGEIDYNLKAPKRSLFLCKPNNTTITKISEAYDIQYYTKLGTVNELSFKIPTIIIKDDVPMENPNITRIKNRYLFKLKVGKVTEYFLLNNGTKVYGEKEYIEYSAYSLGTQLSDKNIREFHHIGNLLETANALLDEIYIDNYAYDRWQIDYVDSYFLSGDFSQREYEISSMSALESIYDMAEKWNAVIKWDTVNHKISFFKAENVGLNKGFYIRDGKYLENFNLQIDTTSTITRVKAFGSDGLNLTSVNPTGQYYVEDFSFYIYPFEYDEENEIILNSSDYMSDELCIALLKYKKMLSDNEVTFKNHTAKINALRDILRGEEKTLNDYQRDLTILENKRDILLAEFQKDKSTWGTNGFNDKGTKEGTHEHLQILAEIEIARARLSAQQTMVQNAELNLADAEKDRDYYIASLSHYNHFSPSEWNELQQFIIEKEYTNDSITDVNELLEEARTVLKQNQEPAIKLTLGIIDFLSVVECQNDWDKLGLGDTIRIKYDRLKVNINAKIIEINYDFENFTITLTIANEKDLKDDTDKLMDLLNKADITSTIVQMDRNGWDLSKENNGKINELINNKWDSLKQAVLAGYDQQITISERGIIVKALDDPNSWLVIQNGFLAITNDAGNTWKHAISKDGIWGEYIFGKVISGVNLFIEDESGVWKTQGSRTTIYDRTGKETMWLGLVSDNARDQFDNILEGEQECFGLKSWNDHTKVELSTCVGIAISRWRDDDWEKVFWADGNGTLYTKHLVTHGIKIINDDGDTILDAENNMFDIGKFQNIVADGKLTTLEKLQIATELHKIHTDYINTLAQAEKYNRSNSDITYSLEAQWSEGQGFPIQSVNQISHCDPTNLIQAYTALMNYISQYIPIVNKGIHMNEAFEINQNDPLMEQTSEIENRGYFIQVFRDYYDESGRLKQAIEDSLFYSGINMGHYYNNLMMGRQGFVAVRSDGKYRAYLNATNGLALEKWENNSWVKKLYASIGNNEYTDGTLIAEELVAKKLRIETKFNEVLLDMDSLNINFSVLDSIIVDDVIVSIEKETLKAQFNAYTSQYNELNSQLSKYINEVYSDRDSSYFGLDQAKNKLVTAQSNLMAKYNSLRSMLDIVFADMTTNTYLSTDLNMDRTQFIQFYKDFGTAYETARNLLHDFLEKSSLQLGRNYNNTIIDAVNGVTVYRGDMVNRVQMNATKGFSLSRNDGSYNNPFWRDLFYVGTEGNLYARDITTHNLKIVNGNLGEKIILDENNGITINGNKGEQIRLNANEGIAINANGKQRFWVGTDGFLYAKKLYIIGDDDEIIEDIDGSYISDLTVNRLKTLGRGTGGQQDIVHIEDNYIKFKTWSNDTEFTKLKMEFEGSGVNSFPAITFGTGNGRDYKTGSAQGKIYKDLEKFAFEYDRPDSWGSMSKLYFNNTDTDNHGQAVYMRSRGGIRLESENRIVMKCVGAENADGSSQNPAQDAYIRVGVTGDERNATMKYGGATVVVSDAGITLRWDNNNYITVNGNGVTVKGSAINLN